jgi:ubiquinone/menaquinone biosynthesis C-methylase UbiE
MADWLETRPWYRDKNVANTVCSLFPVNPSRVLELCCGTGLLLETLSSIFPRTEFIGVDISPRMVERAQERLSHRSNVLVLKQDWVYELAPEWEHAFDVIVVKNALHVLDNVITKLKDLRRVSCDRTTLIIVETVSPNVDANEFIKRLFQFADPEHLKQTFFTERTLTSALKEAFWFMAQYRPTYVRQHIDTEDWLTQKCAERPALESARKLLSEIRNLRVRQALDFDTDPGVVPTRMLRLQYIARHMLTATEIKAESQKADSVQLQLL